MLIIHIMEVKLVELIRIKDLEKKYKTGVTAIYDFDLKVNKIIPIAVIPKNKQIGNVMI